MILVSVRRASCGDSKSIVLDGLEFLCIGFGYYRGPNCAGVFKCGSNYDFVGISYGFFLLAPGCGS